MAGVDTKSSTWGRVFAILNIEVVFDTLSGWFNLAKACWAFLQEQEFAILASSRKGLDYCKSSIIAKYLNS